MYTPIMKDIVRGALAGIAIIEANFLTLHALVQLNCFAIETACVMAKAFFTKILKERQQENES